MVIETIVSLGSFFLQNVSFLIPILVIGLFILYKSYKFDAWEKQGVKGPKPIPFFGNSHEQFFASFPNFYLQRQEKYGKVFGYYDKSKAILSVADPEILRYVMAKDSDAFINRRQNPSPDPLLKNTLLSLRDERWKRARAIVSPTFTSGKIRKMTTLIDRCIKSLIENIESKVNNGEEINAKSLYSAFTMDVIASCAFATKTDAGKNPNDPFVVNATGFFTFRKWRFFTLLILPGFIRKALNFNLAPTYITEFFRNITREIIKERKKSNVKPTDFLQLLLESGKPSNLMQAVEDINAEQLNNVNKEELEKNAKLLATANDDSKLTEDEILAQCLIFFVAGFETTASLLSYASYAMAINEDCQKQLYEEVKHYYDTDKEITYETISKMKYLNAFVNETLRMYSPIVRMEREANRNYKIPNTDITVPKGAIVQMPFYFLHHNPEYFPEPEVFKPERFLPENIENIKPYTFLPFGSGPRSCIGMRFALMEAKLAICNLVLRFKFVKSANTDVPLKMRKLALALLPVERVLLGCELRK